MKNFYLLEAVPSEELEEAIAKELDQDDPEMEEANAILAKCISCESKRIKRATESSKSHIV